MPVSVVIVFVSRLNHEKKVCDMYYSFKNYSRLRLPHESKKVLLLAVIIFVLSFTNELVYTVDGKSFGYTAEIDRRPLCDYLAFMYMYVKLRLVNTVDN